MKYFNCVIRDLLNDSGSRHDSLGSDVLIPPARYSTPSVEILKENCTLFIESPST